MASIIINLTGLKCSLQLQLAYTINTYLEYSTNTIDLLFFQLQALKADFSLLMCINFKQIFTLPVEMILQEYLARLVYSCKKRSFSLASCRNLAGIYMQDPCKLLARSCKILARSCKMQEKRTFSCKSCKRLLQDGFYWANITYRYTHTHVI